MKVLTHRVSAECTGDISEKLLSCHFWWPSHQNVFILEMVRDRAILMKFLTCRVSARAVMGAEKRHRLLALSQPARI